VLRRWVPLQLRMHPSQEYMTSSLPLRRFGASLPPQMVRVCRHREVSNY
jgi:hypothetical protein